jgi:hypothetical protein
MLKITNPFTGAEVQVANQDFSDTMTWAEAKRSCSELGSGWRLPTIEELKAMYEQLHKRGSGNFLAGEYYWSNREEGNNRAWYFYFFDGLAKHDLPKNYPMSVRAVRAC